MVSLDKYPCFCPNSPGLEMFAAKTDGKNYIKCMKNGCGFFCGSEKFQDYMEAFHDGVLPFYKVTRYPLCNHEEPAAFRVSQSEANKKRGYFACGQKKDENCKFFLWADTPPTKKLKDNWKEFDDKYGVLPKKGVETTDKATSPIKKRPATDLATYTIPKKRSKGKTMPQQ